MEVDIKRVRDLRSRHGLSIQQAVSMARREEMIRRVTQECKTVEDLKSVVLDLVERVKW